MSRGLGDVYKRQGPPAALTASATRAPSTSSYRPGRRTSPATCTRSTAAGAASRAGGAMRAGAGRVSTVPTATATEAVAAISHGAWRRAPRDSSRVFHDKSTGVWFTPLLHQARHLATVANATPGETLGYFGITRFKSFGGLAITFDGSPPSRCAWIFSLASARASIPG